MDYDVVVAGAGPAGSACATLLAREGRHVLLAGAGMMRDRPAEVFAPATLRLIRALDLLQPGGDHGARACRGVLSVWGATDEEFYDYELYACGAAMAIDRGRYDRALIAAAQSAGVEIRPALVTAAERHRTGWQVVAGATRARARLLIDATGRHSRTLAHDIEPRRVCDRLVSYTIPHRAKSAHDVLLLEAAVDGWWYACRHGGDMSSLVYLSDADLMPRSHRARTEHLRRSFALTRLIRQHISPTPNFEDHRGSDARTSGRRAVTGTRCLAVGDAAFASDPLSGEGMRFALESARIAADAAIAHLRDGSTAGFDVFSAWCAEAQAHQLSERQHTYASVHAGFRDEPFWRRRIEVKS